eukprot:PhF_6_TR8487/c0_g1_i2/m.13277/K08073/PNKP; bifunctional polynucleotide phosphatase/kinase
MPPKKSLFTNRHNQQAIGMSVVTGLEPVNAHSLLEYHPGGGVPVASSSTSHVHGGVTTHVGSDVDLFVKERKRSRVENISEGRDVSISNLLTNNGPSNSGGLKDKKGPGGQRYDGAHQVPLELAQREAHRPITSSTCVITNTDNATTPFVINRFEELLTTPQPTMVLLTGPPGAGKTTFAKKYLLPKSYAHVNMDTLGSHEKCFVLAKDAVRRTTSFVVDNTNPTTTRRMEYVRLAQQHASQEGTAKVEQHRFRAILVVFKVPIEECKRRNSTRQSLAVPESAFSKFQEMYQEPGIEEGWDEILVVS